MPANVRALIDAGLAGGLSLEQLRDEIDSRLAEPRSQTKQTFPEDDASPTGSWLEDHREDDPDHAVALPTTPALPPDTPRIEGLPRYDDLGPIGWRCPASVDTSGGDGHKLRHPEAESFQKIVAFLAFPKDSANDTVGGLEDHREDDPGVPLRAPGPPLSTASSTAPGAVSPRRGAPVQLRRRVPGRQL